MTIVGGIGSIGRIGRIGGVLKRPVGPPVPPPPSSPDFIIRSDADWASIPSSLWTNGGLIEIEPGTYYPSTALAGSNVFVNRNPSATLTFKATFPATNTVGSYWERSNSAFAKTRIHDLLISSCSKLKFEDLEVVSAVWSTTSITTAIISYTGNCADLEFSRLWIHSGYRGNPDVPIDPLKDDYPELASILPQYTSTGSIASFILHQPFVGDLVANGTYTISVNTGNGSISYNLNNLPTGVMTVENGVITTATVVNAGTSSATLSTNNSLGILSKQLVWPGQQNMSSYLRSGIRSLSPGTFTGSLTVVDCFFSDLNSGIKPSTFPSGPTGSITITGCTMDKVFTDYASFGLAVNQQGPNVNFSWNYGTRPTARSGDPGDPHSDFLQFFTFRGTPPTTNDWPITAEGNVFSIGSARGDGQGYFLTDNPETTTSSYQARLVGNAVIGLGTANGIAVDRMRYSYIAHNAVFSSKPVSTGSAVVRINAATGVGQGLVDQAGAVFNNIANGYTLAGPTVVGVPSSNITLALTTASLSENFVFGNGPTPTTLDESIAYLETQGGSTGKGPKILGYVDYNGRTINRSAERPYVSLPSQSGVNTSTSVSTTWRRVLGGPQNMPVSITNGTLEVANDINGTGSQSNPTTINPGQFIRVTQLSSSTGGTLTGSTVSLNGFTYTFNVTTLSLVQFPRVSNQSTAWSRMSAGYAAGYTPTTHDTAAQKYIISWRVRDRPQTVANASLFAATANTRIGYSGTGTGVTDNSVVIGTTGGVFLRANTNITTNEPYKHHLVVIDTTAADLADRGRWWINGVEQTDFSSRTVTQGLTINMGTNSNGWVTNGIGLFALAAGTGIGTADFEFMWMRWGDASLTLPSFTAENINQFLPGNMADDGTVLGIQPQIYIKGELADYNGNLVNSAGTGTALYNKVFAIQTGTYVLAS